jgi:phosphoribosyl-AMP cyclohydrolase / phosphoribosyl-ATP pyrophosphohydrolase
MVDISQLDFEKLNGLIPAIIVDYRTNKVLMLGFMNKESLQKTIDTETVTFYSRTRKELWTKGQTSGNYLRLIEINSDCDYDSLLVSVVPDGPTCHTGDYSCFGTKEDESLDFLNYLFNLIKKRKATLPENSYTTKLFKEGENRIIQKVGEEAIETVIAAKNNDKDEILNEVSDLIYHLFVMLVDKGIEFSEVADVLMKRHKK